MTLERGCQTMASGVWRIRYLDRKRLHIAFRHSSSGLKVPPTLLGSHRGLQPDRDHLPSSCILLPQKQHVLSFITRTTLSHSFYYSPSLFFSFPTFSISSFSLSSFPRMSLHSNSVFPILPTPPPSQGVATCPAGSKL